MPSVARLAVLLVLALSSIPSIALAADEAAPPGFVALFNGKDLTGWYGLGHTDPRELAKLSAEAKAARRQIDSEAFRTHWRVEDGALVNDGNGPYATTEREYGDIELTLEYRTVAKADSGVYLRGTP